jgi:hypothetical protein
MGAGMLACSLDNNTLFKYTIDIETHQYTATIFAIAIELDFGLSSPRSILQSFLKI